MTLKNPVLKLNIFYILALGLPYSVILIFSAYGPALHFISGPRQNLILSSLFLIILLVSMFIPEPGFIKNNIRKKLLYFFILFSGGMLGLFPLLPSPLQIASMVLIGFTEGRIAVAWSKEFNKTYSGKNRIFIITAALFTAYALLYLANASFPSIPKNIIPLTGSIILIGTIPFLRSISKENSTAGFTNVKPNFASVSAISVKSKIFLYIIIFIIYITAGFTYTIIFPAMRDYGNLDRYYNVLPFVLIIPIAGLFASKAGYQHLLNVGIALLGISYIFFQLPSSSATYYLVGSFIQPGWAFIDLFVWVLASNLSEKTGNSRYLPFCVAIFLSGTVTGAILSIFFLRFDLHQYQTITFLLISLLPLFFVIPMLNRAIASCNNPAPALKAVIPEKILTNREHQIANLLLNNKTQKEICEEIHISINTLKTHTRNIYRKLKVRNKQELRRFRSSQSVR